MDEKMAGSLRMTLGDIETAPDKSGPSGGQQYHHVQVDNERGYTRHGSPMFYHLLTQMADTHDKKSHDYASDNNPYGNYHFAGKLALLFAHCPEDAGFAGRIGEKLYRLANLEASAKAPKNETIEDTEIDLPTIMTLWMADRRDRRMRQFNQQMSSLGNQGVDILTEGDRMAAAEKAFIAQTVTKSQGIASDILQMLPLLTEEHLLAIWAELSKKAGEISVRRERAKL